MTTTTQGNVQSMPRVGSCVLARTASAVALVTMFVTSPAHAGPTWVGGGSDTNFTTAANWNDGSLPFSGGTSATLFFATGTSRLATLNQSLALPQLIYNSPQPFVIGSSSSSTLTLQGASVGGVNTGITAAVPWLVGTGTYTLSTPVILGADQAWNVLNSSGTTTLLVSGPISGASRSLTKLGAGVLALAGANTYSGTTSINGGTLELDTSASLAGPVAIGSLGTFRFANGPATTVSLAGPLSSSGSLAVTGGGAVQLTGANSSFTGATSITYGEVAITSASGLGTGSSAIVVAGNTTFAEGGRTVGGQLAIVSGQGLTLSRNLQLSGQGLRDRGGESIATRLYSLRSTGNNVLSGTVEFSNSSLQSSFGKLEVAGPVTTAVSTGTALFGGAGPVVVSGPISMPSGALRAFAGTLVLTNTANAIGEIRIQTESTTGVLEVGKAAALGGALIRVVSDGGATTNANTLRIRTAAADAAGFGAASVTLMAQTVFQITGANVFLDNAAGGSDLNQTVALRFGMPSGNSGNAFAFGFAGGHGYGLTLTGSGGGTITTTANNGATTFSNNANGLLTINSDVSVLTPASQSAGFGGLGDIAFDGSFLASTAAPFRKTGSGRVTMNGSTQSTLAGNNNLEDGTIQIRGSNTLATGTINIGSGTTAATLEYIGPTSGAGETWNRAINLAGTTGNRYLYASQSGASPGPLVINGPMSAAVTVNGTAVATSGTAGVKTLVLGGSSTQDNAIATSIPNTIVTGTQASGTATGTSATSLQKTGLGTWVLSATNSYTGSTTISGGVLKVQAGAGDIVQNASAIIFDRDAFTNAAAGTLAYLGVSGSASTETVGALTPTAGAARITATGTGDGGTATLTLASLGTRSAGATVDFGTTSGGAFAFSGAGPAGTSGILGGWATFGGTDWVTSGSSAARFTDYQTIGSSSSSATTNFQLTTGSVALSAAASVNSLKLVGTTGTTSMSLGGILTNTTGGVLFDNSAGSAEITGSQLGASASEVIIHTGGTGGSSNLLTVGSLIGSGTTALTKSGLGTLVLTAANAYTGNTTINEGTVRLSGASATLGTISSAANVTTIRQAGTLDLNAAGGATVTIGMLNGSGLVTNSGGGSSTSGTLSIGSGTTTGGTGYFTGILQDGPGGGRLAVTKAGSSTSIQYLTGLNTYTGPTTIVSGTLGVTTLANIGQASGIGQGDATNADTNAASLVFNNGTLLYTGNNGVVWQPTQTPSVSIDRLFTLAGNGTIDSTGFYGDNDLSQSFGSRNSATLILSNPGRVRISGTGARTLTLTGGILADSRGNTSYDNQIAILLADGTNTGNTLSVTKAGNTLWKLTNTGNTYTGATTISAGLLEVGDDSSASTRTLSPNSNLNLAGGFLVSSGTFARPAGSGAGEVQLSGGSSSGFAAGPGDLVVTLGSGTLTWGSGSFNVGTLYLNGPTSQGTVTFTNPIELGSLTRTIHVGNNKNSSFDYAIVSGPISGSGNLTKTGPTAEDTAPYGGSAAALRLSGANAYTGTTTISAGSLVVETIGGTASLSSNLGAGSAPVRLSGANSSSLDYIGAGETTDRQIRVTVNTTGAAINNNGSGPLVLTDFGVAGTGGTTKITLGGAYPGANEIRSNLAVSSGTLNIDVGGASTWTLSGTNTLGTVTLGAGAVLGIGGTSALNASATLAQTQYSLGQIAAIGGPRTLGNNLGLGTGRYFGFTGENSIELTGTITPSDARSGITNSITSGTLSINGPISTGGFALNLTGAGQTVLSGSLIGTGAMNYNGDATGSLTLSGNYVGTTTASVNARSAGGTIIFSSSNAIPGTGANVTATAGSTIAAGYAVDQNFLGRIASTGSSFAVALAADSANNLNFSGTATGGVNFTAASLGAVGPDTRIYSGTLTPIGPVSSGTYRLGGGGGTLDFRGPLTGASSTLIVGGDVTGLGGTVILSSSTNNYGGATTVQRGILQIASLANAGSTSPTGTNSTTNLSSGTSVGTLRYVGSGHASNRTINIASTAGGIIDASGSGALDLTSGTISVTSNATVTLTGSSTADNAIGFISSGSNVIKTGPGRWQLSGSSTYTGQLQVLDGTIVVGSTVDLFSQGNGPFGNPTNSNVVPIVGDSAAGITGTAAMLAIGGIQVKRGLSIATLGPGSTQVTVLGMTGTGTASFEGSKQISVGRDLILQASNGGTVSFENAWTGTSGTSGPGPAVAFTVGSSGNAGTVRLVSNLPSTLTGFNIVNGTAEMIGLIDPATPVTVGSTLGAATLDLTGLPQTLSRLTFAGNSGSVTTGTTAGGTLRLASSGSISGSVAVSGTGHVISAAVALDAASTFNTGSGAALTVSNAISNGTNGSQSLTKAGAGTLTLSAANTFSGDTTVSAGTLLLGHSQALTASTFTGGAGSLSFGGLTAATFGGLAGSSNLALSNTTAGAVALTVGGNDQTTIYSGVLSGAGGLTKSGTGVFTLAGTNTYSGATSIAAGRLAVNGSVASAVTVQAGATLGGSGRLAGSLTGDGLIAPGNSPGILTVDGQITPTGTTSFAFEFSGTAPTWSNASASVNDVLRLTNADPFTSGLGSGNIVSVYFDVTSLVAGDMFLGGFFSDRTSGDLNFAGEIGSPAYQFFVLGNGGGTATSYNGKSYYTLPQYNPSLTGATVSVTTVPTANFASGDVTNGQVTQFVIVPEPGAMALAAIGIAAAAWARRRRRV